MSTSRPLFIGVSARADRKQDIATVIARNLLVRALRKAGLQHALRGRPCTVGFILPPSGDEENPDAQIFVRSAHALLKLADHNDYDVIEVFDGTTAKRRNPRRADEIFQKSLAQHPRVFVFARSRGDLTDLFRVAADAIIDLERADVPLLRGAIHKVSGRLPPDSLLLSVAEMPLALLGMVLGNGRDVMTGLEKLRRMTTAIPAEEIPRSGSAAQISLDHLHGMDDAVAWGRMLASDLRDYAAGVIQWADVDRGCLVSGPSGTGKTTFARALATSCGVPLHIHSLSSWQAKGYLNDLLKAMRSAFQDAIDDAPSILFIDEIDAFGDRQALRGHNEQYQREVINAFLECLDGADGREGVVVLAATNFPEKIDPAILRPGRLDRHIRIPLPNAPAREGILRHHLRGSLEEVDLGGIAESLEGASGAHIEQVVRDARRKARGARREIALSDLVERLPPRIRLSPAAFRRTCVHEAGHLLVGLHVSAQSGNTPVRAQAYREIGLQGSAGVTAFAQDLGADRTKDSLLAEITTWLAGLEAEEILLGNRGDGGGGDVDTDLHRATVIAAGMELSFGLGKELTYLSSRHPGAVIAAVRSDPALRANVAQTLRSCSKRAGSILRKRIKDLEFISGLIERNGHVEVADLPDAIQRRVAA